MSTSALGTTLDAIRAGLILRAGLAGVNVYSGPVSHEEGGRECIWMDNATLNEEAAAMGGQRSEVWQVKCQLWADVDAWQGASAGSTEETIKAARDRALAIFAEVESYINDTYTGTLPDVNVTAGELRQGYMPDGRTCAVDFTLTIEYMKNP